MGDDAPTAIIFAVYQDLLIAQVRLEEKIDDLQIKLDAINATATEPGEIEDNASKVRDCLLALSQIDTDFQHNGRQTLLRLQELREVNHQYEHDEMQVCEEDVEVLMAEIEGAMEAVRKEKNSMIIQLREIYDNIEGREEEDEQVVPDSLEGSE